MLSSPQPACSTQSCAVPHQDLAVLPQPDEGRKALGILTQSRIYPLDFLIPSTSSAHLYWEGFLLLALIRKQNELFLHPPSDSPRSCQRRLAVNSGAHRSATEATGQNSSTPAALSGSEAGEKQKSHLECASRSSNYSKKGEDPSCREKKGTEWHCLVSPSAALVRPWHGEQRTTRRLRHKKCHKIHSGLMAADCRGGSPYS